MYLQPTLQCKNPECPRPSVAPTRLPYPNPPKAGEPQPNWPQGGWQLRLTCRDCDHWYVYGETDVAWVESINPDLAGVDLWCVELQCSEPGCASCTKWHVLDDGALSESEILEFVMRSDPIPVCGNGHSLVMSEAKVRSAQKLAAP